MTMRDRLPAEFAEYDKAIALLHNAFAYTDQPGDLPGERAERWHDAAFAARRVVAAAHGIADGASVIARQLEEGIE